MIAFVLFGVFLSKFGKFGLIFNDWTLYFYKICS